MGMTKTQTKISRKLYDDTQTLINDYIQAMSEESCTDKGLNLGDFRKISVTLKATIDTVYVATVQAMCKGMGEELGKKEVTESLLVDIMAEGLDSCMGEIMPMVLGNGVAATVMIDAMSQRVKDVKSAMAEVEELKRKLHDLDPGLSFEEIMEAAGAKKPH